MESPVGSLKQVLGLGIREHVALVGAGGKTSLMTALAREVQKSGKRVVTSTTTKIRHREAMQAPCTLFVDQDSSWQDTLARGLVSHGHVCVGKGLLQSGKVQGISAGLADGIFQAQGVDCLILEADGSAGHPVKAPDAHEPVIPESATLVVAMMGLEGLGQPLGPETVFRADIFGQITGAGPGQALTGALLARLFTSPDGVFKGTPDTARRVVFLNKADLLAGAADAEELADLILKRSPSVERVVMGSIKRGAYQVLLPNGRK